MRQKSWAGDEACVGAEDEEGVEAGAGEPRTRQASASGLGPGTTWTRPRMGTGRRPVTGMRKTYVVLSK